MHIKRTGWLAIYQKLCINVPFDPSERFPFLFGLRLVIPVDLVRSAVISYIPLQSGILNLTVTVKLLSSNVLSCKLSNSVRPQGL